MSDLDDLASAAAESASRRRTVPTSPVSFTNPPPSYVEAPMPNGAERCWMVHDRGHQYGPHTELELASLVAVGTISTTAMVWRTGSPRWIPVYSIVPMPAHSLGVTSHSEHSGRVSIGVVALLLGAFGIHKFMLGFRTAGLIMLLTTVFTCGVIMGPIALIEGIIYLTKSDAQFHQDYVVNKRDWF